MKISQMLQLKYDYLNNRDVTTTAKTVVRIVAKITKMPAGKGAEPCNTTLTINANASIVKNQPKNAAGIRACDADKFKKPWRCVSR